MAAEWINRQTHRRHLCHQIIWIWLKSQEEAESWCWELQCVSFLHQSECQPQLCLNNSSLLSEGGGEGGGGGGGTQSSGGADENLKTLHLSTLEYLLTLKKMQLWMVLNGRLTFPLIVLSSGHRHVFFFYCLNVLISDLWPLTSSLRVTLQFISDLRLLLQFQLRILNRLKVSREQTGEVIRQVRYYTNVLHYL